MGVLTISVMDSVVKENRVAPKFHFSWAANMDGIEYLRLFHKCIKLQFRTNRILDNVNIDFFRVKSIIQLLS